MCAPDIDLRFLSDAGISPSDAVFSDARSEPFRIYGVFFENGRFRRLPEAVAKQVSSGVLSLHANTAGGRVRFCTDSPFVVICAGMANIEKAGHFALSGSAGFDLYADGRYAGTFYPPCDVTDGFGRVLTFGSRRMRQITIHFPLYSDVTELRIGLEKTSSVEAPAPYRNLRPIVYYGSSITQGGCASRPGNAYENIITRTTGIDHVNLGFSGNAKAEDAIGDYVSRMEMSLFVYDYDHNAPTVDHLDKTHERMFRTIRARQPELPILMLSRPKLFLTEQEKQRLAIIRRTYENARAEGDRNVWLVTGQELMAGTDNDGTVDGIHPNDFGFHSMARAMIPVIRSLLPD